MQTKMGRVIATYVHSPGVHCISTVCSNLFRFHGMNLSEDMCVGLGSGIGFTYLPRRVAVVLGRDDDLELRLSEALGIQLYVGQDWDTDRAWQRVCRCIDEDSPVVLDLDPGTLSHLRPYIKDPDQADLGGHKMVLVGYDDDLGMAYLFEYMWSKQMAVPQSEVKAAWRNLNRAYPSKNFWYEFDLPAMPVPLTVSLQRAFRWTSQHMLAPWTPGHGLPALRTFAAEVVHWPEQLGLAQARISAHSAYLALEVTGSGRGAYRRMYSRFLREAALELQDDHLAAMATHYAGLAREWSKLAAELKAAADSGAGLFDNGPGTAELLQRLVSGEETGVQRHLEWLGEPVLP